MEHSDAAAPTQRSSELMRAQVLLQPGQLQLSEVVRPRPGPGGVVVRVEAALTCGTDLKAFLRGHPKFPMPTLFGHEFAGVLAEVGSEVRGFAEGDEVMAAPTAPCDACYFCDRGQENLCARVMDTMVLGAYAEYIELPASIVRTNLYRKPRSLSYPEAALLEPLACVLHGLSQVQVRADDTVLLLGAGGIALLHILALRAQGVERVIVVARGEPRAALARRLGASSVVLADAKEAREPVLELTGGRGADIVVECTGQVDVWEASLSLARRGGQVVLFGGCPDGAVACFDTTRLHYDQIRLVSPFHFTPRDVRRSYEVLETGNFGGEALITDEYRLDQLSEALTRHQRGDGAKFAIIPSLR
jgi:L-iditol 2-dehydrogenase